MATRIAVHGAAGRMGQRILALAEEEGCEVVLALDRVAGSLDGFHVETDRSLLAEVRPAVVVDFSSPEGTAEVASAATQAGCGLVVGTTGLTAEAEEALEEAASKVPVLVASNMSLGVNLLFSLAARAAAALSGKDFDAAVYEAHHRHKKDAPSGTAKTLLAVLQGAGATGAGGAGVQAVSVRAGGIVGDHTVLFASEGERLELTHRAATRDVFARGALAAARFLADKPAGRYAMRDVLGL